MPTPRRANNLALTFQEVLTAIVRLRSNRQVVSDAASFRAQIMEALKLADLEARRNGYSGENVKLAIRAVVALLDETILDSSNPAFADWQREPLGHSLFEKHLAGEIFFQNLQRLLGFDNSQELADLLEVYYLCLLLGFAGRYHSTTAPELQPIKRLVGEKIQRIRGTTQELSPSWALRQDSVRPVHSDPWVRRLLFGALACILLCLVLFLGFKARLGSGVSHLQTIAGQTRS